MPSLFSSRFFAQNRKRLREAVDEKLIVVTANGLLQRGADSTYAFAQDANFWYLTGVEEPDILLVMNGDDEYLVVPPRSSSRETFDGSISFDALSARSGIANVLTADEGEELLRGALQIKAAVAMPGVPPAYIEHYGMYTNPARAQLLTALREFDSGLQVNDISRVLAVARMVKQSEEVAAIQAAIDITAIGIKQVLAGAKSKAYLYEYEAEARLTGEFRAHKSGHAFEPIVAAGKRACTLHNVSNEGPIRKNDLVVMDVGAEVEHYAADITRTVCFGKPSMRGRSNSSWVKSCVR
jgi:Xaa-Pro aminopeptidase